MGNGISMNKIHSKADTNNINYGKSALNFLIHAPSSPCSGCEGKHWKRDCPFKDAESLKCERKGYITEGCRSNKVGNNSRAENVHSIKDLYLLIMLECRNMIGLLFLFQIKNYLSKLKF